MVYLEEEDVAFLMRGGLIDFDYKAMPFRLGVRLKREDRQKSA